MQGLEDVADSKPVPSPDQPAPAVHAPQDDLPVTVIQRRSGWQAVDVRELWRSRELLFFLVYRDVMVRYKQTALGVAWAFVQPVATMLVFSLFLGRAAGLADTVEHYALFVFAGVLPWTFFSNAVTAAGNSVVTNERLVTKVYFPRLIVPLSSVGASLFDFFIALLLLAGMMAWFGVIPGWQALLAPVVFLLLAATAAGVGILLSALIVAYRDFRYVLNFGVQLWMFATPTIYLHANSLSPKARAWLPLNPAQGLIYNFRRCLLGGELDWYALGVSGAVGLALLAVGCLYFRRVEQQFADII
jgi:lipopolysaccharide transport system permease protein